MRINFRQGLVRVPTNFLSLSNGKVSLVIPTTESAVISFADGVANYLITERTSIIDAWSGPFTAGTTYWLYWDINPITGTRTFGHTNTAPVEGANAPGNPLINQHWYDTTTSTTKVWTGSSWARRIRVFAAELTSGSIFNSVSGISPNFTGTQVGDNTTINVGALVFDALSNNPIKKSDGTFFTTEDMVNTGITSSSHVKMGSIIIEAEAQETIPSYSIVRFVDFNKVIVANNHLIDNGTYGIIENGVTAGNTVNVTLEGLIENTNWDWTAAGINAPLYVDTHGYLTTSIPPTPIIVAAVVDKHTILLRPSSLFLNTFNDPMTTTDPGTAQLSVPAADATHPIVVGDNDPRISSVNPHITDLNLHLTPHENLFLDSLVGYSGGLVAMGNDFHGITRTIQAPVSGITITNGSGVDGNPTLALSDDLAAVESLGATGIAVRSGTNAWNTRAIIAPASGITITNNDGVAGNPTLVLSNDLNAVEGIATYGLTARTADDNWTTRSVAFTGTGISIANGDGVAGNPTLTLANDLNAIEHITTYGLAARTADETWTTRGLIAPVAGISITNADGTLGNPTFALTNDLAQVENLTTTGFAVRQLNNPETWVTRSITAQSGDITVTNGDGVSANTIIGLPIIGTPVTAEFNKITTDTKGRISATTSVTPTDITTALAYTPVNKAGDVMSGALVLSGDPTLPLGAATKQYVDNLAAGLDPKGSVKAATTATITLSGNQNIDGVSVVTGDRVLVKNQTDQTTNGIYDVVSGGVWTRSADASVVNSKLTAGAYVFVEQGTVNAESGWVLISDNPITASSLIVFQQFSGAGQITAGSGLSKNGNILTCITPTASNITISGVGIDLTPTAVVPGTWKSVTVDTYGRITNATNPTTLGGYGISDAQPLDGDLTAISAFSGTGFAVRTANNVWTQRNITGSTNGITVTYGDGIAANPSLTLDSTYVAFPGTAGTFVSAGTTLQAVTIINGGLRYDTTLNKMRMVENGAWLDTGTLRTIAFTDPSEGMVHSIAYNGSQATITTTLSNDLQALEGLTTTGITARTAANTWTTRQVAGTAGRIGVTNGNGVIGDPTIDLLASGVTANTYVKSTVDIYGRVTAGIVAGSAGASTIADYGLTAVVQPLNTNLTNISAYNTNGIIVYTGTNTFVGRQLVATTGVTATNIGITNPGGQAGDFTLTLQGDLGPFLSAQSGTGFPCRTAATTWAQRQITGTSNRISVTNPTGSVGDPTIDIDANYVGQNTITTLGTITTGTWNGTAISVTKGGTGITSNGTIDQYLAVSHTNATNWEYKTVSGTTNQVIVTHTANSTVYSLPQSIDTAASVTFSSVNAPVIKSAILALTDAALITWNMANGTNASVTLAANHTMDNPSNLQAGAIVVLKVTQDATGGHTLSYGTAFKWDGASAPVVAAGANAVSILTFICDGTNLYEMSRALNVA